MSEIIKQSSLIPEQGREQRAASLHGKLRHEFGEWWIAVLQLSFRLSM